MEGKYDDAKLFIIIKLWNKFLVVVNIVTIGLSHLML
jgi:hypothetical protein